MIRLHWVRKRIIVGGRFAYTYTAWTPGYAGESYFNIARRGNQWRVVVHVRWRTNDEQDSVLNSTRFRTLTAARVAADSHAGKIELEYRTSAAA